MYSVLVILLALATLHVSNAIAPPSTDGQPLVPELPEGFFAGYNNPDGTSTLSFFDTHENITFTPIPAPSPANLDKRQALGYGCWPGTLDVYGVDSAMNLMRQRLSQTPIGIGQLNDWPPYFGYNANGVYVYACENSGIPGAYYYFRAETLDWMSYNMDQRCGAYVPGYIEQSSFEIGRRALFGKARSGTAVCQGNPRSPR